MTEHASARMDFYARREKRLRPPTACVLTGGHFLRRNVMKRPSGTQESHIIDFQRASYIKRIRKISDVWLSSWSLEFVRQLADAVEEIGGDPERAAKMFFPGRPTEKSPF